MIYYHPPNQTAEQHAAAVSRMRYVLQPPIIPIEDKFTLVRRKQQAGRVFLIVAHPRLKESNEVCQWAEENYPGTWLIPTLYVAGDKWPLNPKASDHGWLWLLVKG